MSPLGALLMLDWKQPILLVEDDLSLRASLCQFLQDHGYRTVTAGTAQQGWEALKHEVVPLCLLDLNLPDGSGLDLLRKITAHAMQTRVIVMTAFDLQHIRPAAALQGLAGWLTKPVSPVELLDMVQRTLGHRSANQSKKDNINVEGP